MSWNFELIDGPYGSTAEGPAWDGTGLLFTHIPSSRIMRYDPETGKSEVSRQNTNYANGLVFAPDGRLYACEGGARRVVRYEPDGTTNVLADSYEGKRLNMPNDLAIDPQGRVWFTDPFYEGSGGPWSQDRANKEIDHDSVYRLDPQPDGSWTITRVTFDTTRPNGILFSLDYRTLYVAQTAPAGLITDEKRELRAYPVNEDATLGDCEVFHSFNPHRGVDGMVLDTQGNIVATAGFLKSGPGPGIFIFSPSGELLETHPLPEDRPTNCTFGGPDLTTLYVTTWDGHLLKAETDRQGRLWYPPLS